MTNKEKNLINCVAALHKAFPDQSFTSERLAGLSALDLIELVAERNFDIKLSSIKLPLNLREWERPLRLFIGLRHQVEPYIRGLGGKTKVVGCYNQLVGYRGSLEINLCGKYWTLTDWPQIQDHLTMLNTTNQIISQKIWP